MRAGGVGLSIRQKSVKLCSWCPCTLDFVKVQAIVDWFLAILSFISVIQQISVHHFFLENVFQ